MNRRDLLLNVINEAHDLGDSFASYIRTVAEVKCVRGCHHCCNLLPMTTIAEAAAIILKLGDRWTEQVKTEVARHANLVLENPSSKDWFHAAHGCAFLQAGECSIYEARPFTCRTHLVVSDPELCAPGVTKTRLAIDPAAAEQRAFILEHEAADVLGMAIPLTAPLPWALVLADGLIRAPSKFPALLETWREPIAAFCELRLNEEAAARGAGGSDDA